VNVSGTLVFDGECGFCTRVAGLAARVSPGTTVVAWQLADLDELGILAPDAAYALQYVGRGSRGSGSDGVALLLVDSGRPVAALGGRLLLLPGIRPLAQAGYRVVAANRHRLPGGTPACAAPRN
jgi:predicted DCC family thiol-disulfide oxidoreductase YuxK